MCYRDYLRRMAYKVGHRSFHTDDRSESLRLSIVCQMLHERAHLAEKLGA